jgi:BASS family bile acid:Na+ symporter
MPAAFAAAGRLIDGVSFHASQSSWERSTEMTLAEFVPLALKGSLFALVFALGLRATARDVVYLFCHPGLLLRSILAMNIVMLGFATLIDLIFPLPMPVKIALIALALSPVPPILPRKQAKAGGHESYAVGLLVAASILSIVLIPLALFVVEGIFGGDYRVPSSQLIVIILLSVIGPLCLGLVVRIAAPALAEAIARPISVLAMALLVVAALPIAYSTGAIVWQLVGNGVVVFLLLFTALGLLVGHFLGGPSEDDRTVLALATGTRHPGVAIAIAAINFPDEKATMAVVLWHLIFAIIISVPYVRWRRHVHENLAGETDD